MSTSEYDFNHLAIGDKIRRDFGPKGIPSRVYHVRGFIDGMVIVRTWIRSKNRYEYLIWHKVEWIVYSPYQTITKERVKTKARK